MSDIARRMMRLGASARLAAWLIGAQVVFILLSYSIPQRGIFPDEQMQSFFSDVPGPLKWLIVNLGLDHAFTSVPFYVLASLLVLNLLLCTLDRTVKRARPRRVAPSVDVPESAEDLLVSDDEQADSALRAAGASVTASDGARAQYYMRRGDAGFIGSVVMHSALILVVAGGVISGLTTFRGEMLLTEGQTLPDAADSYLSVGAVPRLGSAFKDFSVTLRDMRFTYAGTDVTDAVAHMVVTDSSGSHQKDAKVNFPLKAHGKSFLLQDGGHSVLLKVESASGEVLVDSFVNLASVTPRGYADSIELGGERLALLSRPDASIPVDVPMVRGLNIVSPIVGVALAKGDSVSGYRWITPGAPEVTVGGFKVSVQEVRVWNRFLVRADDGRYLIYIAFGLIIVGGLIRFLDPDRWMKAETEKGPQGTRLRIWGSERYRPGALPREGRAIVRSLRNPTDTSEEENS